MPIAAPCAHPWCAGQLAHAQQGAETFQQTDALASRLFGVELDADDGAGSPDELAQRIAEEVQKAAAGQAQLAEARKKGRKKGNKQGAKAAAREALREQAEQGASRAIREVFRKLASALHPDRESDLDERARKTALMQQANQAYAARDLLALLELQLSLEQIDPSALASMAEDRLVCYNLVLEEQSQCLEQEIAEVTAPFMMNMGSPPPRALTPAGVQQALDEDVRELQAMCRGSRRISSASATSRP